MSRLGLIVGFSVAFVAVEGLRAASPTAASMPQVSAASTLFARPLHLTREIVDPISGKTTKSSSLRFPRFHQWEAVTELATAVAAEGVGKRYLIQHSAGSGKTDSIAWTAQGPRSRANETNAFS